MTMRKIFSEIKEGSMKKFEKKRLELEVVVREARKRLEDRRLELWNAEKALSFTVGVSESGGWIERRSARRAQEGFDAAKVAMDAASNELAEAEEALENHMAAAEETEKKDFKGWAVKATAEAARLSALLRNQQSEMLATARALVALHVVAERTAPRRIKMRRAVGKFVKVEPCDPKFRELYPAADPPGSFSIELFRAHRGEREGKWRILPGQDLDPGEVEIQWSKVGIPAELAAVDALELGYLYRPNGTAGKLKEEKLNAYSIEHIFLEEKDLQAAMAVGEG